MAFLFPSACELRVPDLELIATVGGMRFYFMKELLIYNSIKNKTLLALPLSVRGGVLALTAPLMAAVNARLP